MLLKHIAQLLSKMTVPIYSVISNVRMLPFPRRRIVVGFHYFFSNKLIELVQNDLSYLQHVHFIWLLLRLNLFSVLKAVISDTEPSSQKGFRDYLFISFCVLCFHVLARLSVARHFLPALHCVFLLASHLAQGNQKISLPAVSISGIFL